MARQLIPINPDVLKWAIEQSGYSIPELAIRLNRSSEALLSWLSGEEKPGKTEVDALANLLKRQPLIFLLPQPPRDSSPKVEFRKPTDLTRVALNPRERHYLREANRVQKILLPIVEELRETLPDLPKLSIHFEKDTIGSDVSVVYQKLGITNEMKSSWASASQAFKGWRYALEQMGVFVFCFSLREESCRGFSLWQDNAPVIVINTSWNYQARIYTLFHELGHLLTRTNSVCAEESRSSAEHFKQTDDVERWCEKFSAAFLMPDKDFLAAIKTDIKILKEDPEEAFKIAKRLASHFKVSLRAAVLRLIDLGYANWDLYAQIPPYIDRKKKGGSPPDEPRSRAIIRTEEYGIRVQRLLAAATKNEILSISEALSVVDAPYAYLKETHSRGY